jgi:hypothetical protein
LAASLASSGKKGSGLGKICRTSNSAVTSNGPHKNSDNAILLMLNASCAFTHTWNCLWAGEPAREIWIRKLYQNESRGKIMYNALTPRSAH